MTNNCKIELFGSVGRPPKLVAKKDFQFFVLSVATRDDFIDENTGKQKEKTLWHDIIVFNSNVIQDAKNLQKGERVRITGTLSCKPTDGANGYKISQASVVALAVQPFA